MQTEFRAVNFDKRAKAQAEAAARQLQAQDGKPRRVEYRDHYNDYSVVGDYVVVRAA